MDADGELAGLVEEITQKLEAGDRIDLADYARAPDELKRLRKVLPALEVLVLAGQANHQATSPEAGSDHDEPLGGRQLGDYRIVRELGRGGMGVVYEAEQLSMGRRVALKVLPFAALVQDKLLQRFRNEVRAAAALDHDHIVPIYSVGEERGVHYYAMQLVRGQSLAQAVEELRKQRDVGYSMLDVGSKHSTNIQHPASNIQHHIQHLASSSDTRPIAALSTVAPYSSSEYYRRMARLGIQAADALQHAHDQGVFHRDIKPSNLLLDREGKLYVTDFGLARIGTDVGMTVTGDLVGTLRYMAPEQALGKRVVIDHRADVYSLGATLYELLTLQPAFAETDRAELLKQIAFDEPRPLRKLDRHIPTELETIVAKAMSKQPDERYQTAELLASDLRAFLDDRPIKARPTSAADRARKWTKRHETFVRTAGAALLVLTAILAVSVVLVKRAHTRALVALEETSDLLYVADMTTAYQAHEKGWFDEAQMILNRYRPIGNGPDRRGMEWHLLQKSVQRPSLVTLAGHDGPVNELAVFPDHRRLASVGADGKLRIWDTRERRLLKTIQISDAELYSVAVSPDGRLVAAGSTAVHLCDLDNGDQVKDLFRDEHNFESLAFSPDGQHLVAGARYHDVFRISLDGDVENRIACESRVESLEFISGSDLLLVPNRRVVGGGQKPEEIVELRDETLSTVERELDGSQTGRPSRITSARTSPCGKFVLAGERYTSRTYLFNRSSGRIVADTPISRDRLTDVAYSPNGKAIAVGYQNGRIGYFELNADEDGNPSIKGHLRVVNAHLGEVMSVKFVDSMTLASCGFDGLIRICTSSKNSSGGRQLSGSRMTDLKLSPDGSHLLYVSNDEFGIAKTDNGEVVFRRSDPQSNYSDAAWSQNGERLAVCYQHVASVALLDRQGRLKCLIPYDGLPEDVALSPTDSLLAVVGDSHLQFCNSDDGREVFRKSLPKTAKSVAFSHDGTRLAYGGKSGEISTFDVSQMRPLRKLTSVSEVNCIAFSPDDSLLATGHFDSVIRVWDVETGGLRSELPGHDQYVRDLQFSLDGRTLVSSSRDGTIRLWSVDHNRSYGVLCRCFASGSINRECRVNVSPDGRVLAVGYRTQEQNVPHVLLWKIDAVDTR
jgi:serine/threonine protein kinase/WD40 repeat protein